MPSLEDYLNDLIPTGSSYYYSTHFLTRAKRQELQSMLAFIQLIRQIPYQCSDSEVAHAKFTWWQQQVLNLNNPDINQHPILIAIKNQTNTVKPGLLQRWISQVKQPLPTMENLQRLLNHCENTAKIIAQLVAGPLNLQSIQQIQYAENLLTSVELLRIIIQLKIDLDIDRCYLPVDLLTHHQFADKQMSQAHLITVLKQIHQLAENLYQQANDDLPLSQRYPLHPLIIFMEIQRDTCEQIAMGHYQVLTHHTQLTPLRKLWLAWKFHRTLKRSYIKRA